MKLIDKILCYLVGHKWEYSEDGSKGKCLHCGKEVEWPKNIASTRTTPLKSKRG